MSAETQDPRDHTEPGPEDAIFEGDLLDRILGRFGLGGRRAAATIRPLLICIAITWLPLLALSAWAGTLDSFMSDVTVHVRLLLVVPVLLLSRAFADRVLSRGVCQLRQGDLVPAGDEAKFKAQLERLERLRNSKVALVAILAFAIWGAVLALREERIFGTGTWSLEPGGALSLAGWWYVAIGLSLMQALRASWFWKWIIWAVLLWNVSRLRLQLKIAHPDLCGGLAFMGRMPAAFTGFALGLTGVLSANWVRQILAGHATLEDVTPLMIAAGVVVVLFLYGPLALLSPMMMRFRRRSLFVYDLLANRYGSLFERRWLGPNPDSDDELLGTGDIQSLADLGGGYERIRASHIVPFTMRQMLGVLVTAGLPFLLVVATKVPISELLMQLAKALL